MLPNGSETEVKKCTNCNHECHCNKEHIDEYLDVSLRSDYLRIRDGTYVPKPRRRQVIEEITQILKDHGHEEG